MVRAAPLRERRWTLLALAQYQSGAQGEALATLHQLKAVLPSELGIDPARTSWRSSRRSCGRTPRCWSGALGRAAGHSCPWQGLKAYDVDDADRFFGRERRRGRLPGDPAADSFAGAGRPVRVRQVLDPARRRRRPRSERAGTGSSPITPGRRPLQALTVLAGHAATAPSLCRRPVRGGLLALRGPGRAPGVPRPAHRRQPQAPVGAGRDARRPAGRRGRPRGLQPAGRARPLPRRRASTSDGLRAGRRGPGPAGRPAHRARPGGPARAGGARRPRRAAAAVARPAGDLEAPRGQHPDRRRLPRHRRDPRRRGPVRRAPLRAGRCRRAGTCCATWSCAWSRPAPRASRPHPGPPPTDRVPTPSTTS